MNGVKCNLTHDEWVRMNVNCGDICWCAQGKTTEEYFAMTKCEITKKE